MTDDRRYPRLLLVTANPLNRRSNNGLSLSSLLEGWPRDRIAQVYVPFVTPMAPEFDVCARFWALTPRGLRSVPGPGGAAAPAPPGSARPAALLRLAEARWARALAQPVREWWYGRPALLAGPAMREIEAFAPDVILSTLGLLSLQEVVATLRERLRAPVVPFYTDDWITTEYRGAVGEGRLRRRMAARFRELQAAAPLAFTISDTMAEEYARRYGGEFLPFTRCVEAAPFRASPMTGREGRTVELVYAGQLGLGRWRQLRRIGEAIRAEGADARLTVYTVPAHVELYGPRLEMEGVVRMAGHVANDALPGIYDAADVLVHVESFDPETVRYTRFSLSTKCAEYLMAARPVLGFGPAEVGTMRHLAESGGAVVVGEDGDAAVRAALRTLLADRGRLAELGRRGRAFALERHEAGRRREDFRAALARAAGRRMRSIERPAPTPA